MTSSFSNDDYQLRAGSTDNYDYEKCLFLLWIVLQIDRTLNILKIEQIKTLETNNNESSINDLLFNTYYNIKQEEEEYFEEYEKEI